MFCSQSRGNRVCDDDNKIDLMQKMGQKNLTIELQDPIDQIPSELSTYSLVKNNNQSLTYSYDSHAKSTGITNLLQDIKSAGLKLNGCEYRTTRLNCWILNRYSCFSLDYHHHKEGSHEISGILLLHGFTSCIS